MKKESTPWTEGVLLVCTKCHKSISPSSLQEEGNCGDNLKMYLKKKLKDEGLNSQIRVVTSSCLDVCIDEEQAVSFASTSGKTETFILHPEKDREELLEWLKERTE